MKSQIGQTEKPFAGWHVISFKSHYTCQNTEWSRWKTFFRSHLMTIRWFFFYLQSFLNMVVLLLFLYENAVIPCTHKFKSGGFSGGYFGPQCTVWPKVLAGLACLWNRGLVLKSTCTMFWQKCLTDNNNQIFSLAFITD